MDASSTSKLSDPEILRLSNNMTTFDCVENTLCLLMQSTIIADNTSHMNMKSKDYCNNVPETPVPNHENVEVEVNTNSIFLQLPPEVRWEVLKRLPQKDAIRLRFTCNRLRFEIDQSYKITIIIDDSKPVNVSYLTRFSSLLIKKIVIKEWMRPELTLSIPKERRYYVQSIDLQGQILPKFLHQLLFDYPQVRKFSYNHRIGSNTMEDNNRYFSHTPMSALGIYVSATTGRELPIFPFLGFQQFLRALTLKADMGIRFQNLSMLLPKECSALCDFLHYDFPLLKIFALTIRIPKLDMARVQSLLLDFLRRHHTTLKSLNLSVYEFPMVTLRTSFNQFGEGEGYNLMKTENIEKCKYDFAFPLLSEKSLSGMKLHTLVLNLPAACLNMWQAVLDSVVSVERFNGNILYRTQSFYQSIVLNNYKTLKILKFARIFTGESLLGCNNNSFDCHLLSSCEHLEQLTLDNEYLFHLASDWEEENYPEITAIEFLPRSLCYLEIFWMRIPTSSMETMINNLYGLKHIVLRNVGAKNGFGVTPEVCQLLIDQKRISYFCVVGINSSISAQSNIMDDIVNKYSKHFKRGTNSLTIHRYKLQNT